jgi:integrase
MTSLELLDATGRHRSPATTPGHHCGRPPRNKGLRYPPDPPSVEEIVAVMRCAGKTPYGLRTRALMVVLWRSGLRISEALALAESDLDMSRGAVLVRRGKGGKRREVGMDAWARPTRTDAASQRRPPRVAPRGASPPRSSHAKATARRDETRVRFPPSPPISRRSNPGRSR